MGQLLWRPEPSPWRFHGRGNGRVTSDSLSSGVSPSPGPGASGPAWSCPFLPPRFSPRAPHAAVSRRKYRRAVLWTRSTNRTFSWHSDALPRVQFGLRPRTLLSLAISLPHVCHEWPTPRALSLDLTQRPLASHSAASWEEGRLMDGSAPSGKPLALSRGVRTSGPQGDPSSGRGSHPIGWVPEKGL